MKILSIIGARPQFIKCSPIDKALRKAGIKHLILHTGQHYDQQMSQVFFQQMGIPQPDINLGIGSASHAVQTGEMLIGIEEVLLNEKPDWTLLYGDTNSTIAGALACAKLNLKSAHIEAGLRSFNRRMPEEHNRVLTDHCSDVLFCPTETAVDNLANEGLLQNVHLVGDVMYDALLQLRGEARNRNQVYEEFGISPGNYILATIHRPYNVDDPNRIASILNTLDRLPYAIILPLHPRTAQRMEDYNLQKQGSAYRNINFIEPLGYLDMLLMTDGAALIITDSGGLQKEAYMLGVPCLTLRPETEWVETLQTGWNQLVEPELSEIMRGIETSKSAGERPELFGDGHASQKIVSLLTTSPGLKGNWN